MRWINTSLVGVALIAVLRTAHFPGSPEREDPVVDVPAAIDEPPSPTSRQRFSGRVVDAQRAPIPRVRVEIAARVPGPAGGWHPVNTGRFVETDEGGWFDLDGPEVGGEVYLTFQARGFASKRLEVQDSRPCTVVLEGEVVVRGRTIDVEGRPYAGVQVAVRRSRGEARSAAISAADGRFEIDSLAPGDDIVLVARGADQVGGELRLWSTTPVVHEVELRMAAAPSIRGVVLDADDAPLAEVELRAGEQTLGVTGADGGFSICPPVGLPVIALLDGFVPEFVPADAGSVTLLLRRAGTFEGTVLDAAGVPAAGAWVVARSADESSTGAFFATPSSPGAQSWCALTERGAVQVAGVFSDVAGRFRLSGLDRESVYTLSWARQAEMEPRIRREVRFAPGNERVVVDVELAPLPARMLGRVTLNGAPVEAMVRWRQGERTEVVRTDPETGDYYIEQLPSGRLDIEVRVMQPARLHRLTVDLPPLGEVYRDVPLVADLIAIDGRVTRDGRGVGGCRVRVVGEAAGERYEVETDADGAYRIEGLPGAAGELFRVEVLSGDRRWVRHRVAAGSNGVDFDVTRD